MQLTTQIAKHLRDVHLGGNWTTSSLKQHLADLSWEEATTQIDSFNTIATLAFHIHYYVGAATKVLQGGVLDAKDELSFKHPPIQSQEQWNTFLEKVWADAEIFASEIEKMADAQLETYFTQEKYGTYFRNLHGIIEHAHYHLGQIVILKKLIRNRADQNT
jgi:uncharacterized damage-inducible protein DinB